MVTLLEIPIEARGESRQITLEFDDAARVRELSGELARNLKILGQTLDVQVSQRGGQVSVRGAGEPVGVAALVLEQLYDLAGTGFAISPPIVDQACRLLRQDPSANLGELFNDVVFIGHRKTRIFPRSANQRRYVHTMRENDVVFGVGPAGTGKTYLAMAMAVAALSRGDVARIILCRPAVEAGEKLGFLPGDLVEKVNPYLRPLYDALYDMVDRERADRFIERGAIEVAPLAFMRGRTLSEAFAILDEAQNTTSEQMRMFLTRLGADSKAVVTGDITQTDLPRGRISGLAEALEVLRDVPGIGVVEFSPDDVVRHALVARIIRAYERYTPRNGPAGGVR